MSTCQKVPVTIYCKIYTDTFDYINHKMLTGDEIYKYLIKDSGHCFDEGENNIPGDCNIWYLGSNEKFGELKYKNKTWKWGFGESSFDTVEEFVQAIYEDGNFTEQQFRVLMDKIKEGRSIDNMYDIKDYLICEREEKPWAKTEGASSFRNDMKQFVSTIESYFQNRGVHIYQQ